MKRDHVLRAHEFFLKHGGKAVVLARFVPIVRTFLPFVAGGADMPYRTFAFYNVLGGVLWVVSMTLVGYFVGKAIPNVEVFFTGLIALMIAASAAPAVMAYLKERRRQARNRASLTAED